MGCRKHFYTLFLSDLWMSNHMSFNCPKTTEWKIDFNFSSFFIFKRRNDRWRSTMFPFFWRVKINEQNVSWADVRMKTSEWLIACCSSCHSFKSARKWVFIRNHQLQRKPTSALWTTVTFFKILLGVTQKSFTWKKKNSMSS